MAISQSLKEYLDHEHIHYDVLPHPEAFRAALVAQTLHTPAKEIAKVVVVKADNRFVMTVLPASWNVDLHRLRDVFMTHHVRCLPSETSMGFMSTLISRLPKMRKLPFKPAPIPKQSACDTGTSRHSSFQW